MSGQQIYENFANGVGPGGLMQAADHINSFQARYDRRAADIRSRAAATEEGWTGDAVPGRGHPGWPEEAGRPTRMRATAVLGSCTTAKRPSPVVRKEPLTCGGAKGTRTPDPLTASEVRYQLRHSPEAEVNSASRMDIQYTPPAAPSSGGRLGVASLLKQPAKLVERAPLLVPPGMLVQVTCTS